MPAGAQLRGDRARKAILEASGKRFLSDGYRATSIEAVASQAGVSRPTVYAHFASKEEIFRTIVSDLHDAQLEAMRAAVDPSAAVADRLYAALASRFVPFVELTTSSAHGAELLDENSRVCGDINRRSRERSLEFLTQLLADADAAAEISLVAADLDAASAASIFFDAANGAKGDASVEPEAYQRQLRRLVGVISRGLSIHAG